MVEHRLSNSSIEYNNLISPAIAEKTTTFEEMIGRFIRENICTEAIAFQNIIALGAISGYKVTPRKTKYTIGALPGRRKCLCPFHRPKICLCYLHFVKQHIKENKRWLRGLTLSKIEEWRLLIHSCEWTINVIKRKLRPAQSCSWSVSTVERAQLCGLHF